MMTSISPLLRRLRHPHLRHLSTSSDSASTIQSLLLEPDHDALATRFKALSLSSPSFRLRGRLYRSLLDRLSSASRLDLVADVLEAQKLTPSISSPGFASRLVFLYGRARLPEEALKTFHQLPSLGCPHSVLSFNSLISALAFAGKPDLALQLFRSIPAENDKIKPDVYSYNAVISLECRRGDFGAVMKLLEEMKEAAVTPNVVTFTTLINAFYKAGKAEEAERAWGMMAELGVEPDVTCYNAKVRALALEGRILEAAELVSEMRRVKVKPDGYTYTGLIMGQCKAGNLDGAKKVYDEMLSRRCVPNKGTFKELLPRACEAGDYDWAVEVCKLAITRKFALPAELLQAVVDGLVVDGRVEDAKSLVEAAWASKKFSSMNLKMPPEAVVE